MTNKEIIEKELEFEKAGKLNETVDIPALELALPVTGQYKYLPDLKTKIGYFFLNLFIIKKFTKKVYKNFAMANTIGRENLKGIKNAVVTSNHTYMFDCLVNKYALKGHKLNIIGAPFNNRSDKLGLYMRAGGMLPLSENFTAMKNFNKAIEKKLKTNHYVMFYPEQNMWYLYEKPRNLKDGAYHYAVKYNVPIIPIFNTFKVIEERDINGKLPFKSFTVNILKPIYPDKNLSKKENIEMLKEANYKAFVECYEKTYNKKLVYEK